MKRIPIFLAVLILFQFPAMTAGPDPSPNDGYWRLIKAYGEGERLEISDAWTTKITALDDGRITRETSCSAVKPPSRYVATLKWSSVPSVLRPGETLRLVFTLTNDVSQTGFNENVGYLVAFDPSGRSTGRRVRFGTGSITAGQGPGASAEATHEAEVPGKSYGVDNKMHLYVSSHGQRFQYMYEWVDGEPPAPEKPGDETAGSGGPAVTPGTTRSGAGWQSRGRGTDGVIRCDNEVDIGAPAVLVSLTAGENFIYYRQGQPANTYRLGEGFWIQPKGGAPIIFTKTDARLMSGAPYILPPGEYCAYPNLPADRDEMLLAWEVRVLAPGEVPPAAPLVPGQDAGVIITAGGGQSRGYGKDGVIKGETFILTRPALILEVTSLEAGISFKFGGPNPTQIGEGFWIQPVGGKPLVFHQPEVALLNAGYTLPAGTYYAYPNIPAGKDYARLTITVLTR